MKHLAFAVTLVVTAGIAPACAAEGTPLAIVVHGGAGRDQSVGHHAGT